MGNFLCPAGDIPLLASVARDICPFPNYNPSPLFINMLSINSSNHLKNHYTAVQSSLTPEQLEDFTQGLRTTFGREGKVTLGGVGVVALSLAVLFDTLAKQVKGEWVSFSRPIPGLFVKDPNGYYPPQVYTVSKYLRLVPHIANNPTRMREETERYIKQLIIDRQSLDKLGENHMLPIYQDITALNMFMSYWFAVNLEFHLRRINDTTDELFNHDLFRPKQLTDSGDHVVFNLNCDPETAEKDFLAEVQKSDNRTQEAFEKYSSLDESKTWLHKVAKLELLNAVLHFTCSIFSVDSRLEQREDFDLKANALRKWPE